MRGPTKVPLRLLAFVLAFGLAFGVQPVFAQETPSPELTSTSSEEPAPEITDSIDNLAFAVNTKDDSSLVKFAFDVRAVMDGVVDETNAAVAVASCEDCLTVAVAIQVVLIVGDADTVTPENAALAVNYECTSCQTLASAYQFVFSVDEDVQFNPGILQSLGRYEHTVAKLLNDLEDGDIDLVTFQASLDVLMDEFEAVIRKAITGSDDDVDDETAPDGASDDDDPDEAEPTGSPTPLASESPMPQATDTEPSPTPSN